ncbi:histidinol-phosphate aminotransferase [Cnuella takakiae]|uniref:Histidinol-phosphate aminotransferase n=1 Tax=Cnuella takakiae TaxID=1302690 RepID=A0A1M5DWM0_9BACT|nr:histidinol-phosphate transaminase [Cnuella takakiae]OLY93840.1 hypothetical protein BUE76_19630 [Cnuella takakiae]SHF71397.1 histidinol-phosphate aminotransferase [Cnuella takakiae]
MATLHRRTLLKKAALFTGGYTLLPGLVQTAAAASVPFVQDPINLLSDKAAIETTPPGIIARLLANENPFGPSDKAKKALHEAISLSYQYPIEAIRSLEQKIQTFEGLQKDQVLLSAGSSPLLLAAALAYGKGTIVSASPTYEDLLQKAEELGTKVVRVPLTADYQYDLDAMEKAIDQDTSLVYICNPNNPTATVTDAARLKAFCERVSKKTTVFVDEAYIDYLDNPKAVSLMEGLRQGQNIIIARTFSKLYGFAGLRVGYVAGLPATIARLEKYAAGPMSISATSLGAALAAYQDQEFLQDARTKTVASRSFLYETLKAEGYSWLPSAANFVMFPISMEGRKFATEMMKRGVGIRTWKFNSKDWCRVSIGTMEEMQAFAKAFKELA